jgi:uncharacterized membrane protein
MKKLMAFIHTFLALTLLVLANFMLQAFYYDKLNGWQYLIFVFVCLLSATHHAVHTIKNL